MLPHILYLCGYVSFVKTSYRKICYYLIILKIYYMYKCSCTVRKQATENNR